MSVRSGFAPSVDVSSAGSVVVLISQLEAARLLGVERTTIWRMCRPGDLALVHIGCPALVTRESLDKFVAAQIMAS